MTVAPVETLAALAFDTSKRFVSSIDERDLVYFVLNVGDLLGRNSMVNDHVPYRSPRS